MLQPARPSTEMAGSSTIARRILRGVKRNLSNQNGNANRTYILPLQPGTVACDLRLEQRANRTHRTNRTDRTDITGDKYFHLITSSSPHPHTPRPLQLPTWPNP